jgi:hypothetical protein
MKGNGYFFVNKKWQKTLGSFVMGSGISRGKEQRFVQEPGCYF